MYSRRITDAQNSNTVLYVSLFGNLSFKTSRGETLNLSNKRAVAILGLLCIAPEEKMQRELLCKTLWPKRYDAQAKASLRQCLLYLSKVLNAIYPNLLNVSRTHVAINAGLLQSDLSSILRAINTQNTPQLLACLNEIGTSQLLENLHHGSAFNKLLEQKRWIVERSLENKLEHYLKAAVAQGASSDYQKVNLAWSNRAKASELRSIAILPFPFESQNKEHAYFADGIVSFLNSSLEQLSDLKLINSHSLMALYQGGRTDQQISELLALDFVLEGSLKYFENEMSIHIKLLDTRKNSYCLNKQYQSRPDEIFGLQEAIFEDTRRSIEGALDLRLNKPTVMPMTANIEAYNYYVEGCALTRRIVGEGILSRAISLFEKALAIDNQFAKCWSALAEANAYVTVFTPCGNKAHYIDRMAECAQTALAISPNDGLALCMLGVHKWTQGDPASALDLAYLAHHHESSNPAVSARLGSFLLYCGLSEKALPHIQYAVEHDPLNGRHLIHLCNVLLNLGDTKGALEVATKISAVGFPSIFLGLSTALSGEHERGTKLYGQTRLLMTYLMSLPTDRASLSEAQIENLWETAAKGVCSGQREDNLTYRTLLDSLQKVMLDKQDVALSLPAVWLGYAEMVFSTLGQAITPANMSSLGFLWVEIAPLNETVNDPKFLSFAEDIGLVKVWDNHGWPPALVNNSEYKTN